MEKHLANLFTRIRISHYQPNCGKDLTEILIISYVSQIEMIIYYYRDDWDLPDKTFSWATGTPEYPYFSLEKDSGLITMKHGVPEGRYVLHFKVYDRKHTQTDVPSNVTVVIKEISHEAVVNSGSFRLNGITAEDFIRVWDDKEEKVIKSKVNIFR